MRSWGRIVKPGLNTEQKESKYGALFVPMFPYLDQKYPDSEFFWSLFSRIQTEYGYFLCKSPYLVQMRENVDQENSDLNTFHARDLMPRHIFLCLW